MPSDKAWVWIDREREAQALQLRVE